MGTWDAGNFDNDAALGLVHNLTLNLQEQLTPPDEVEELSLIMGAVAVYKVLIERCYASPPERDQIAELRETVLSIYDAEIDELDPSPAFKTKRRSVIEQTFQEFLQLIDAAADE